MNTVTDISNVNDENFSCYDCNSIHDGDHCYQNKTNELKWNKKSCAPEETHCKVHNSHF